MRDDGRQKSCRDRCCRLEWSNGDMLKAGSQGVAGRPEGPGVPEVHAREERGALQQSSRSPCLPPSLHDCLPVSSASLPPYTLSHFSPMSHPDQGGGSIKKRESGEGEEKPRGKERERFEDGRKIPERRRMMMMVMLEESMGNPAQVPPQAFTCPDCLSLPSLTILFLGILLSACHTNIPHSEYVELHKQPSTKCPLIVHVCAHTHTHTQTHTGWLVRHALADPASHGMVMCDSWR